MLINKAGRLHDRVRLIDLSKSAALEEEDDFLDDRMGTAYYLAPEVFEGRTNMKTDVWAVGVMAYMLVSNRPPFNGEDEVEIMKKAREGHVSYMHPVWKSISFECQEFIRYLM